MSLGRVSCPSSASSSTWPMSSSQSSSFFVWVDGCQELFRHFFSAGVCIIVVTPLVLTYFSWLFKGLNGESLAFTRMARMLLFVKFARAFRTTRMFLEVRVLTLTLVSSVMALFWSMVC